MKCPFCGSEHVHAEKRGYSWTIGLLSCLVLSLFGLFCGYIGSDKLVYSCDECGEKWKN